ncbi:Cyclin-dependent kinase [Arachis hypogaea]|nr:Cyclin-dependent kinase [Arachis hypogaea]
MHPPSFGFLKFENVGRTHSSRFVHHKPQVRSSIVFSCDFVYQAAEEITQIKTSSSNETVGMPLSPLFVCNWFIFTHRDGELIWILGTPTEKQWPGVTLLRDWHTYPKWEPQNLARTVPTLGPDGVDLLTVCVPL